FTSRMRRRVPQIPYDPTQESKSIMAREQPLHRSVVFDYPGQTGQGVSLRNLRLNPDIPILGGNDMVFDNTGMQSIVLRIQWPGYEKVEWCCNIVIRDITRMALGIEIATNFANFCAKIQDESPSMSDWVIAPSCIRFEHLYLLSLDNIFPEVWQADIEVDL
ncbi:hypothetical protein C8R44DRAFT_650971, partial [Mycena epipterygia]